MFWCLYHFGWVLLQLLRRSPFCAALHPIKRPIRSWDVWEGLALHSLCVVPAVPHVYRSCTSTTTSPGRAFLVSGWYASQCCNPCRSIIDCPLKAGNGALALRTSLHDPTLVPTVQQAHGIALEQGSSFVLAGGNVKVDNHYHGLPPQTITVVEVLRLVPNLRRIHLDVLSKATPGTAIWILKTDYFLLWVDVNGGLKVLWGTGIREWLFIQIHVKL